MRVAHCVSLSTNLFLYELRTLLDNNLKLTSMYTDECPMYYIACKVQTNVCSLKSHLPYCKRETGVCNENLFSFEILSV